MKIRKDDILLILLSLLFASCRVGKAEPVADPMEEEGISVVRYDKLLDEYVRFNSFSALQKMNLEYALPTKLLIEDVLAIENFLFGYNLGPSYRRCGGQIPGIGIG